jgi:hypothetical protein
MLIRSVAICVLALTAIPAFGQGAAKTPAVRMDVIPGYFVAKIEGFTVAFGREAWSHKDDTAYAKSPMKVVEGELKTIVSLFPPRTVDILRRLPIWVEWNKLEAMENGRAGNAVGVYFGGNEAQAERRGMHPLMARTVTILRLKALTEEHQPERDSGRCVILHEIAHAVHDQLLGSENAAVLAAFSQAMARKLYGKDVYATTNDHEFFAELSCAYFDQLAYFPRTRAELLTHDPQTHKLMESVWGKAKPASAPKMNLAVLQETPSLESLRLGAKVSGPESTGKPTLVLFWNAADHGSLTALTKIGQWEAGLRGFGFVAVAVHETTTKGEEFKSAVSDRDITYAIHDSKWTQFSLAKQYKEFPLCVVYDHKGACVFRGSPFDAELPARMAFGAGLVAAAGIETPHKGIEAIVADMRKGKSPSSMLPRLATVIKSKDEEAAKAAKVLLASLIEPGQKTLDAALAKTQGEPVEAFFHLERLAVQFKDSPVGAKATEQVAKLKEVKAVATEIAARTPLAAIAKIDAFLSGRPGAEEPSQGTFRRDNADSLRRLEQGLGQMRTAYPNTRATQQAIRIAARYGIS